MSYEDEMSNRYKEAFGDECPECGEDHRCDTCGGSVKATEPAEDELDQAHQEMEVCEAERGKLVKLLRGFDLIPSQERGTVLLALEMGEWPHAPNLRMRSWAADLEEWLMMAKPSLAAKMINLEV